MPISLFIDNNAWDVLFDRHVDLRTELPPDEFAIQITREAEFEIPGMPCEKRQYVEAAIADQLVSTDTYFGFYDPSLPPEDQRVAGFDFGRFASEGELAIIRKESSSIGPGKRPTGLFKHEADVALAARSAVSAILTCDGKRSLKRAKQEHNSAVIDLKKWDSRESLAGFIQAEIARYHD